jgi:hypothetical protein
MVKQAKDYKETDQKLPGAIDPTVGPTSFPDMPHDSHVINRSNLPGSGEQIESRDPRYKDVVK